MQAYVLYEVFGAKRCNAKFRFGVSNAAERTDCPDASIYLHSTLRTNEFKCLAWIPLDLKYWLNTFIISVHLSLSYWTARRSRSSLSHTMVSPRKRLQKPLSQFFDDFSVPCVAIQNINVIGIGLYRAILIDNEIIRPHIGPLIWTVDLICVLAVNRTKF